MDASTLYHPDLGNLVADIPADSIVSRSLVNDDRVSVTLFGFAAGQELSEHTSSYPAVLHVLHGEADLTLGADRFVATAGAWAHMPARLPHSVRAKTPVHMLLTLLKAG